MLIVYPAAADRAASGRFRNYFDGDDSPAGQRAVTALLRERDLDTARRQFSPPDAELFERLLDLPVAAAHNAPHASGQFPLVVYALGLNNLQQENTVLWEFLASDGFVVAVVPQLGPSAGTFRMRFEPDTLKLQAADLALSAGRLREEPYVRSGRPWYVGHSSGALAGLMAAGMTGASGLVSLDGDLTSDSGVSLLTGELAPNRGPAFPVLALHKTVPEATVNLSFVRSLAGFGWAVGFQKATHFDFQNWPLYGAQFQREDQRAGQLRDMKTGAAIYRTMCRLTLAFLSDAPGPSMPAFTSELSTMRQIGMGGLTVEPAR